MLVSRYADTFLETISLSVQDTLSHYSEYGPNTKSGRG